MSTFFLYLFARFHFDRCIRRIKRHVQLINVRKKGTKSVRAAAATALVRTQIEFIRADVCFVLATLIALNERQQNKPMIIIINNDNYAIEC